MTQAQAAESALATYDRFLSAGVVHRGAWAGLAGRLDGLRVGLYGVSPQLALRVMVAWLSAGLRARRPDLLSAARVASAM